MQPTRTRLQLRTITQLRPIRLECTRSLPRRPFITPLPSTRPTLACTDRISIHRCTPRRSAMDLRVAISAIRQPRLT